MNEFKETILQGIKKGEITAESKWRFLAHDYFFWFLTVLSTICGALAISSILHRIATDQAALAPHLRDLETVSVFIQTLPYLWLLLLLVLGGVAWFNFNKTSNAYKHQLVVVLGMLVASMLIGGILFAAGVGSKVDQQVRERVPVFEKQRMKREAIRNNFLEKRGEKARQFQNQQPRPFPKFPPQRVL